MTVATTSKTQRDQALRQVDVLQRRLVTLHRQALADILDMGIRAQPLTGGGVGHISDSPIRRRLDVLRKDVALLMGQTFVALVHHGHRAAILILDAGLRGRQHREAEGDDPTDDAGDSPDSDGGRQPFPSEFPPLSAAETQAILRSQNAEGMTWEEQLWRSSHRVADPQGMANALSQGFSEGEGIAKVRERIKPLVENLSVSAQRIARTEGLRLYATAQQQEFLKADTALRAVGKGIAGMKMHCAMMPTSAKDHKERNGKVYKTVSPGQFVADDDEKFPGTPYGHPACSCWADPILS